MDNLSRISQGKLSNFWRRLFESFQCPHCGVLISRNHLSSFPKSRNLVDFITYCPYCGENVIVKFSKKTFLVIGVEKYGI